MAPRFSGSPGILSGSLKIHDAPGDLEVERRVERVDDPVQEAGACAVASIFQSTNAWPSGRARLRGSGSRRRDRLFYAGGFFYNGLRQSFAAPAVSLNRRIEVSLRAGCAANEFAACCIRCALLSEREVSRPR